MIPFPDKKYSVIYADPPWKYQMGGCKRPEIHYLTMPIKEIKSLPVNEIAKPDCVLYLWATMIHLDSAIDTIRSWGFAYKTNVVWDKQSIGTGYWFRGRHEHLLVGTTGSGLAPKAGTQYESLFVCKKGAHSAKPLRVKQMIEQYHPNTDKIELFARPSPLFKGLDDGWDYWGNEV